MFSALGQSYTWNAGSGNLNSTDWVGGTPPENGAAWVFSGVSKLVTNNFGPDWTNSGISFAAGAGASTLASGSLTLIGNIVNNSSVTQTVSTSLYVPGSVTFSNGIGSTASSYLVVTGSLNGDGTITYNSTNGGSRLELRGNNSEFTGRMNFNGGRVQLSHSNAVSKNADYYVNIPNTSGGAGVYLAQINRFVYNFGSLHGTNFNSIISANSANTTNVLSIGWLNTDSAFAGQINSNNVGATGSVNIVKVGTGTFTLYGTNTYNGTTTVSNGVLQLGNGGTTGRMTNTIVIVDGTGIFAVNKSSSVVQGTDFKGDGITGTGGFGQYGNGTTTLNVANTYTGVTDVRSGTLRLASTGSINNSSELKVNSVLDATAVTGFTVGSGQTVSGSGQLRGNVSMYGTLSPGNSPGTLNLVGNQTWYSGGNYNWQVYNATGVSGTGYDTVNVTGTLDLSNLTVDGFNINLWSLNGVNPDSNGEAINFDNTVDQSWTLLTASGGINGFDSNYFKVNLGATNGTAGFVNEILGSSFFVEQNGNNLLLNYRYAPVPEPNPYSYFLFSLGGLALLIVKNRKEYEQ